MIPTEEQEGKELARLLDLNWYLYTHIANEIWIAGRVGMLVNRKKKIQGLKKWVPDYMIILKNWWLLFIELKRQRKILKSWKLWASPSVISEEQKKWIEALNKINNVEAYICFWALEAWEKVKEVEER